jgi:hypothetical protein
MKKIILSLALVLAFAIPKTALTFPSGAEEESQEEAGAVHYGNAGGAMLSPQQQLLLPRREKIGDKAWSALGSENPNRAAVLLGAIQEQSPEKTVDIFYLGFKDFTIVTDPVRAGESFTGGTVIDKIYMF